MHGEIALFLEKTFPVFLPVQAADSTEEKLMYIRERRLDVQQLALPLQVDGLPDTSPVLRGFKGDNPEQEFEIGVNQSGHYKCSGCGAKTANYIDLAGCFAQHRLSYQARQKLAVSGKFGKCALRARPLANLNKADLVQELEARNMPSGGNKPDLECRLKEELQGKPKKECSSSTENKVKV